MSLGIGVGVSFQHLKKRKSFDPDAWDYIKRVEKADKQILEPHIRRAINNFIIGCKSDESPITGRSNWDSILAGTCFLLAGPQTLDGALVPLHASMPTPTNYNFVGGDYNRVTGLKGDGSTKYVKTNFFDTLPAEDIATAIHTSIIGDEIGWLCGFEGLISNDALRLRPITSSPSFIEGEGYLRDDALTGIQQIIADTNSAFLGLSRPAESQKIVRFAASQKQWELPPTKSPNAEAAFSIFQWRGGINHFSNSTISFAFAGLAVDLEALDAAVQAYLEAIS